MNKIEQLVASQPPCKFALSLEDAGWEYLAEWCVRGIREHIELGLLKNVPRDAALEDALAALKDRYPKSADVRYTGPWRIGGTGGRFWYADGEAAFCL